MRWWIRTCGGGSRGYHARRETILLMLSNPSLCAQCTVRPNKPKHRGLERIKFYFRAKEGECLFVLKRPELPTDFEGRVFIGRVWEEEGSVCDLPLIGW